MFKYSYLLKKPMIELKRVKETDIRKTRTCEKCKGAIPLDQIRLYPKNKDTNILVCEPCSRELNKNIKEKSPSISSKTKPLLPPNYTTLSCSRCDYQFRIDENKAGVTYNLKCPYCGKSDKLKRN